MGEILLLGFGQNRNPFSQLWKPLGKGVLKSFCGFPQRK
jgi:hypothetical protein